VKEYASSGIRAASRAPARQVPPDRLAGGMRAIRATEAAKGLDAWPRVVMRRRLPGAV
jgi:hypothetical protein